MAGSLMSLATIPSGAGNRENALPDTTPFAMFSTMLLVRPTSPPHKRRGTCWQIRRTGWNRDLVTSKSSTGRTWRMQPGTSVISPLQTLPNIDSRSATNPGHALTVRFNQKNRLYFDSCASEGITFVALPIEIMGGWHPDAVWVISMLSSMVASSSYYSRSLVSNLLISCWV